MPSKDIILCEKQSLWVSARAHNWALLRSLRQAGSLSSGPDEKSFLAPVHLFVSLARLNDILTET